MIKIPHTNDILDSLELYNAEGNSLGMINEIQFSYIRNEIKKNKYSGYFVINNGVKVFINNDGSVDWYKLDGRFATIVNIYKDLLSMKRIEND